MQTPIPLDKMTTAEKMRAIEEIWEDLLSNLGGNTFPRLA
jgi:hypothetical protein